MRNPIRIINDNNHPEEPGFMCAGMPRRYFQAMRLKHSLDKSVIAWLTNELTPIAKAKAQRNNWRVSESMLLSMVDLAVYEFSNPSRFIESSCWKIRAGWLKTNERSYRRVWFKRYNEIFLELEDWSNQAYNFIRAKQNKASKL